MCIRDRPTSVEMEDTYLRLDQEIALLMDFLDNVLGKGNTPVSYTHLRAHETVLDLVCRLLLEKKHHNNYTYIISTYLHIHTHKTTRY